MTPTPQSEGGTATPPEDCWVTDAPERWMVDYENEEGEPQHAILSWTSDDPTKALPEAGEVLVRLSDLESTQRELAAKERELQQARGEALEEVRRLIRTMYQGSEHLIEPSRIDQAICALKNKPSPARGEQINADAQMVPSSQGVREDVPHEWHEDMRKAWEREKLRADRLQRELQQAHERVSDLLSGVEEANSRWLAAKKELQQARGEALAGVREFLSAQYHTSKKAADVLDELEKYLKPSPASGEPQNTAPQGLPSSLAADNDPAVGPAGVVPDDPVAVYTQIRNGTQAGHVDGLFALAAHYEAKGMRRAAALAGKKSDAPQDYTDQEQDYDYWCGYTKGREDAELEITIAAAKEADRG